MDPNHQELPMPLTSEELIVVTKCLVEMVRSGQFNEKEKEVIRRLGDRINRYATRQGAFWDQH